MEKRQGTITAPGELNILPHEMATARALADAGYDVEFMPRTQGKRVKSADLVANGVVWELKSPTSGNIRVVQKHIRAALHQSRDIVFDSRRMKGLSDVVVEREVRKWAASLAYVRRMLYVARNGRVAR
ncbi:MAG: hypothetical protein IJ087_16140 [Eggerthellaceae bacterium]|nr:hypothetical protein [Eggerthellaceae bacterium]